jgi:hypothetical protein
MRPHDVVKEIERVLDEYKPGENVTPKRKIDRLLRSLSGFTSYTDEMMEGVQMASDNFYDWDGTNPPTNEPSRRNELMAAVYRLRSAVHVMEDQLPREIQTDI